MTLFFQVNRFYDYEWLLNHIKTANTLEYVYTYYQYKDTDEGMVWKHPSHTAQERGGDCADFALLTKRILDHAGYETKIYTGYNFKTNINHVICFYTKNNSTGIFSNYERISNMSPKQYFMYDKYSYFYEEDVSEIKSGD
jgi:predicted transglutaminase-like cysteine proteinase